MNKNIVFISLFVQFLVQIDSQPPYLMNNPQEVQFFGTPQIMMDNSQFNTGNTFVDGGPRQNVIEPNFRRQYLDNSNFGYRSGYQPVYRPGYGPGYGPAYGSGYEPSCSQGYKAAQPIQQNQQINSGSTFHNGAPLQQITGPQGGGNTQANDNSNFFGNGPSQIISGRNNYDNNNIGNQQINSGSTFHNGAPSQLITGPQGGASNTQANDNSNFFGNGPSQIIYGRNNYDNNNIGNQQINSGSTFHNGAPSQLITGPQGGASNTQANDNSNFFGNGPSQIISGGGGSGGYAPGNQYMPIYANPPPQMPSGNPWAIPRYDNTNQPGFWEVYYPWHGQMDQRTPNFQNPQNLRSQGTIMRSQIPDQSKVDNEVTKENKKTSQSKIPNQSKVDNKVTKGNKKNETEVERRTRMRLQHEMELSGKLSIEIKGKLADTLGKLVSKLLAK